MQRNLMLALLGGILHLASMSTALAGLNSWTIKGPPGGFYRDMEASTTDSNVFYAAYGRSFFRSTDGGGSWQETRDFVGEAVDIAVDPTDGNRLYLAVLNEGLFRSEDGGQSFTAIAPASPSIWSVGVGGADGRTVYYATNSGSFRRSSDRGATWSTRTSTLITITYILVEGATGDAILALRGSTLMRSSDGGGTWSDVSYSAAPASANALVRISGTLILATSAGIFVSNNDGASWSLSLSGSYKSLAADPAAPGTVYAADYARQAIGRSTDAGVNWTPMGASLPFGARKLLASGSSRFLVANNQGVQRSTDNAATWSEAAPAPIASGASLATTTAANAKIFAYTTDDYGGLFASSNDAAWERLNVPASLGQISMAVKPGDSQTIYLGAFSGMYRSNNGGNTWTSLGLGISGVFKTAMAIDPGNTQTMYTAVSAGGTTPPAAYFYRSVDGGATWAPRSVNLPAVYALQVVIDPANSARIFLAGYQGFGPPGRGGLYQSIDGGVNWSQIAFIGQDVRRVAIDPSDSNRLYVATASGLFVSSDGGANFVENTAFSIIANQPATAVAIDPVVPTIIYAASYDPGNTPSLPQAASYILRSIDRGQTWEKLRTPADGPRWLVGDLVLDPNIPSLVYVNTSVRGVATFEIANNLLVSISGHSGIRAAGVASSFTLKADNLGTYAATNVRISATLPAELSNVSATMNGGTCAISAPSLVCSIAVLQPSQSINVVVNYTPPGTMALPVSATIVAHERDADNTNNSAHALATTGEVVDLQIAVTPADNSVIRGGNLIYSVQVTNGGPIAASAATMDFTLAAGLSLGATPPDCSVSGARATCSVGSLAVGASRSFSFSAVGSSSGAFTVNAAVAAAATAVDMDMSNNSVIATVNVREPNESGGGALGLQLIGLLVLLRTMKLYLRRFDSTSCARMSA